MAINASSGGQLQGGSGGGSGLTQEDVQDIVADQIEVGNDINIGLQATYDDQTGKLILSLAGATGGGGSGTNIIVKENGTARGTATTLNFVGPSVDLTNNVATITGGLDNITIYENTANRGNFTSLNFVSGASVSVANGVANVTVSGGGNSYTLPMASATTLGGIKLGSGLSIDGNGVVSVSGGSGGGSSNFSGNYNDLTNKPTLFSGNYSDLSGKPTVPTDVSQLTDTQHLLGSGGGSYTLPTASTSVLGGVRVDGTTILINNGVISSVGGGSGGGVTLGDVGTYLNNNGYATQTYVQGQVTNLVNGAPGALNTLNELATALNNDASFATTITNSLAGKVNLSGGTMTGALILSGAPAVDLQAATKKYVDDKFTVNASASVSPSFASAVASQVSLNSLAGVSVSAITAGQILGFNGTEFVPVANSGAKGDTGAVGPAGAAGVAGLSISAATVTLAGRLQLTLTDNSVVDAGNVSGIKSATVNGSGNLILTKQDNSTIDAGSVVGPQGATGAQGIQGITGSTGVQGPAGLSVTSASVNVAGRLLIVRSDSSTVDAGSVVGPQGIQGIKGDTGATGAVGATGATGATGAVGAQGIQGATGATGTAGATGPAGANGVGITTATVNGTGKLIITKTDSTTVDAGSVVGPTGATGATGAQGPQGATGATGLGIYSVVVDGSGNLQVTLTDATTVNAGSTVGPQGPQGAAGPAGRAIANGGVVVDAGGNLQVTLTDGTTINAGKVVGPQGSTGATGATGAQGIQGVIGATGATGATGTSYTVNGKVGSVQVYGLGNTTQGGYDLEVDLSNKANKLTTARNIALTGKVTGLVSFDGSANVSMTTAISGVTTSDVTEGTNQYHTDARSRLAISSISDSNITSLISYDNSTGQIKYRSNTSYITEGSNLYFTNTRADARADVRIGASSINALSDVDTVTAAPTNGQVLTWTGSAWTPATSSGGGSSAISSVNAKTGIVVLNTDDISEGSANLYYTTSRWDTRLATKTTDNLNQGVTNKYFSDSLARNALAAGTGLSYNSASGTFSINATTSNVTEGSNLYYTNTRFDTRLGQSNLAQHADVADTTPTTGQALVWDGGQWAPSTVSSGGGGGGGASSGIFRAAVQVNYDASGNLSSVSVLNGGISAALATAAAATATVTFTFTGSVCLPLGVQVYGYQQAANIYVTRAISSDYTVRTVAGGGTAGSPTAFSSFSSSTHQMTISLTKALSGASASLGQITHCVVQFVLANA